MWKLSIVLLQLYCLSTLIPSPSCLAEATGSAPFTSQSFESGFGAYITTNAKLTREEASADASKACSESITESMITQLEGMVLASIQCESYPGCVATPHGPFVTGNCDEPTCKEGALKSGWICDYAPVPEVSAVVFCECQPFPQIQMYSDLESVEKYHARVQYQIPSTPSSFNNSVISRHTFSD